jgi:hypothetical protein
MDTPFFQRLELFGKNTQTVSRRVLGVDDDQVGTVLGDQPRQGGPSSLETWETDEVSQE